MDWMINSILSNLIVIVLISLANNALFICFAKMYYKAKMRKENSGQLTLQVEEANRLTQMVKEENALLIDQLRAQTEMNTKLLKDLELKENWV